MVDLKRGDAVAVERGPRLGLPTTLGKGITGHVEERKGNGDAKMMFDVMFGCKPVVEGDAASLKLMSSADMEMGNSPWNDARVTCPRGHVLTSMKNSGERCSCDLCKREGLPETEKMYSCCQQGCNYDLCQVCFHSQEALAKDALAQIQQKAAMLDNATEQPQLLQSNFCESIERNDLLFFALAEGVLVFMVIFLANSAFNSNALPQYLIILIPLCMYWLLQCTSQNQDIGGVTSELASMKQDIDDRAIEALLKEMRVVEPRLEVKGEAWTTVFKPVSGSKGRRRTSQCTHAECRPFEVDGSKDESGYIEGLEQYRTCVLTVEIEMNHLNPATKSRLEKLQLDVRQCCSKHGRPHVSVDVILAHPSLPIKNQRTFVTRSPGVSHSWWRNANVYFFCSMLIPFGGTFFRLLFLISIPRVKYVIRKNVW
jgi:hypothetical protein